MADPNSDYSQYLGELQGSLRAQGNILPQQSAMEQQLSPMLQSTYFSGLQGQAQGMLGMYGNMAGQANAFQGQYLNSQLAMMGGAGQQATQAAIGSLDPNSRGIFNTYGQQALADLQLGSSLNAQQTDIATQTARAAAQSRGLNFSRQGTDLEVLNTYQMGQQRQQQRQQIAQNAYQMGSQQQQVGLQGFLSPAFAASQPFGLQGIMGGAQQGYAGLGQSSFLQPESQYYANIRANRIQQENANSMASAQQSAGLFGGFGQIAGSMIGAYAKMGCWVAREVYGKDNPKWEIFRVWMVTESPKWFFDLYAEHGESFAKYISNKPILKRIIRFAMDFAVESQLKKINSIA